jgi:replicative DNA helicase
VGGATYLSGLADNAITSANVVHYARLVHEKALLRKLIRKSTEITSRVYDYMGDVEDLLDEAEQAIFDVSESRKRQSVHSLRDVLKDNFKTLDKLYQRQERVIGVPSGFEKLDELTAGFQKGELIIIAGRPSMGKTALALNIARNAAIRSTVSTVIFSLEMSKEQLANRMLCSEAIVDGSNLRRGFIRQEEWMRLVEAAGKLADCPIYIDDTPAISVLEMRAKCRRLKADSNLGLAIVDYLQLMRSRGFIEGSRTDSREQEISEISRSLKALAKELNIPVIALSQLNRRVEDRKPPIPQLADLRESGAIEQDADVIAFVYRDEVYNKDSNEPNTAEIIVGKQRNGPIGIVKLRFRSPFTRFDNPSYED